MKNNVIKMQGKSNILIAKPYSNNLIQESEHVKFDLCCMPSPISEDALNLSIHKCVLMFHLPKNE